MSRIGVRVRDVDWGTVDTVASEISTRQTAHGFEVTAQCRSRDGEIDLDWSATICGGSGGALSYELTGTARGDFEFARIGICVLLPADVYGGRPFSAMGRAAEAKVVRGNLPTLVAPPIRQRDVELPLFPGFRELDVDLEDGGIWMSFDGDILELEDQRNWTDGTFKIYSSSVSDPLPRRMDAGNEIHQRLRLGLKPSRGSGAWPTRRASSTRVGVRVGSDMSGAVPRIGAARDHDDDPAWDASIQRLQGLGLAHVRVELRPSAGLAQDVLVRAAAVSALLDSELELVLFADPGAAAWAANLKPPPDGTGIARLIVVPPAPGVCDGRDITRVRAGLPSWLENCPILGGTDSDFAELNAARPQLGGLDGLSFAMNPQVHDTDEQALIESLVGQRSAAETAASFADGRPISVSPITLKPRPHADPRQTTSFAAAWLVGSVAKLAASSVASVTYFELTGPAGLIGRPSSQRATAPYPVGRVLEHACAWRGSPVLSLEIFDESLVTALAVNTDQGFRVLLGNLAPHEVTVELESPSVPGTATVSTLAPLRGEPSLLAARNSPHGWSRATFDLKLEPFSVRLFSAERVL